MPVHDLPMSWFQFKNQRIVSHSTVFDEDTQIFQDFCDNFLKKSDVFLDCR